MKAQSKNQTRRELRRLRQREKNWERTVLAFQDLVEHYKRRANRSEYEVRAQAEKIRQLNEHLSDLTTGRVRNVVLDEGYQLIVPVRFG